MVVSLAALWNVAVAIMAFVMIAATIYLMGAHRLRRRRWTR